MVLSKLGNVGTPIRKRKPQCDTASHPGPKDAQGPAVNCHMLPK